MDKYQCLKLIRCQVFSPNCQKITWGHHGGHLMPPILFFSKNKNDLSNQMHSFFPRTKITWGHHVPPMISPIRGHQTLPTLCPPPTYPTPPLTLTPPPTTHHPHPSHHHHHPTPPPPSHHHPPHPTTHLWRKSGALMPDISWVPLHSLPIR